MRHENPSSPRGAALPLAMILLAVLTVIAAAAVSLSSKERQNAADDARPRFLQECANAAQAKLWAEMAQHGGTTYLGKEIAVSEIRLPGGTRIAAPAHYDSQAANGAYPNVKELVIKATTDEPGAATEQDCTNGACGLVPLGSTHIVQALCIDAKGRALEIELGIKFAL